MITLSTRQFAAFQKLTRELTGVSIADTRRSMLSSRIGSRLRALEMQCVDAYLERVQRDPLEQARFIDRVTTHETYFFRTARVWDYLENRFLPAWQKTHKHRECRVWSAAASSGEESYSTAMIMHEFQLQNPGFRFSIHGSDVSEDSIAKCREGIYRGRTIERLRESKPEFLARYLCPVGDAFEITANLKSFVSFSTHNLFEKTNHFRPFDLILCRNVLIYFERDNQQIVLSNLARTLSKDGKLIIGESEHLPPEHQNFEAVESLVYQRSKDCDAHQQHNTSASPEEIV